jgi:hypothetical protein
MVHGSWCSTFDGVGALLFDVLPITIGAAPLGQCHNLPLMTKMFLCGGACLYTAVTSSKIAREGLPSNGTSAPLYVIACYLLGAATSVVKAKLRDEQGIGLNFIDHAMFISDTP